ncbi:hypothetical protein [Cardiobacterium hominis]|uniref:hypothetical protein n=1 Tax=Cardiobacterium hominis TaxID=2718 RepID=UPI00288B3F13|nr:hypothetical protein [Cardiobacterium hominis]
MRISGTFRYDETRGELLLKRDDGARCGVMRICLPGDAGCTAFDTHGEARQYCEVVLWNQSLRDGWYIPTIATATAAPRDRTFRPGKWAAQALALFGVGRLFEKTEEICHHNSAHDGNCDPEYKRPPRTAFMPEFCLHWRSLRYRALRGWLWLAAILTCVGIGSLLLKLL